MHAGNIFKGGLVQMKCNQLIEPSCRVAPYTEANSRTMFIRSLSARRATRALRKRGRLAGDPHGRLEHIARRSRLSRACQRRLLAADVQLE